MQVKLLIEGGNMQPGPVLSQKLGPLGMNVGQIIQKINDATKEFKGLKVPVELDINAGTKEFEVKVFSPPVAELLKKELGLEKGSGEQKKTKIANASIEQIILIAKTKLPNLLSRNLKAAVKTILGSCVSLGILVENKNPKDIEKDVDLGIYDKEINAEQTQTPEEKKKKLAAFFSKVKEEQEKIKKLEEEAAKAAEAAKAVAAPMAGAAATTEPVAGAKPGATTTAVPVTETKEKGKVETGKEKQKK